MVRLLFGSDYRKFTSGCDHERAICSAATGGKLATVRLLLQLANTSGHAKGINPSSWIMQPWILPIDSPPLWNWVFLWAVSYGYEKVDRFTLDQGAFINV
jgi:hypothetical protein